MLLLPVMPSSSRHEACESTLLLLASLSACTRVAQCAERGGGGGGHRGQGQRQQEQEQTLDQQQQVQEQQEEQQLQEHRSPRAFFSLASSEWSALRRANSAFQRCRQKALVTVPPPTVRMESFIVVTSWLALSIWTASRKAESQRR